LHLAAFGAELEQQRTTSYSRVAVTQRRQAENCRCFERISSLPTRTLGRIEEMDDKSEYPLPA
jgi:hypothetical protein